MPPSRSVGLCLAQMPGLELGTAETGNCAVPWDQSKCKATAGMCKDVFWVDTVHSTMASIL